MSGLFAKMSRLLRYRRIYILPSASASMVSRYADGHRDGRTQGYLAGLQAAREAVVRLEPLLTATKSEGGYDCCGCLTPGYLYVDAIDAIDALKTK